MVGDRGGAERAFARAEDLARTQNDPDRTRWPNLMRRQRWAVALQRVFLDNTVVRVRIGLHAGNPVREGEDFFGNDVNLAARVADQASGGEVLVSARLHDLLAAEGANRFGEPVEVALKGLPGTHRVYRVAWE